MKKTIKEEKKMRVIKKRYSLEMDQKIMEKFGQIAKKESVSRQFVINLALNNFLDDLKNP